MLIQSLGAFKSVAARTGEAALPLVAPLIDCLVDHLTASEVIDFLPFIGMLTHRYKVRSSDCRHRVVRLLIRVLRYRLLSWRCLTSSWSRCSTEPTFSWNNPSPGLMTSSNIRNCVAPTSLFCSPYRLPACLRCSSHDVRSLMPSAHTRALPDFSSLLVILYRQRSFPRNPPRLNSTLPW